MDKNKIFNNDIPKYIKKKQSSTSKSKGKSRHKHKYVDCLFVLNNRHIYNSPHKGIYCKICGKIGNFNMFEGEPIGNGMSRMLHDDEIFEKYKDLEKFYIEDIFQKYVNIVKKGD